MSEAFTTDWLGLREPYDLAARSTALLDRLVAWRQERCPLRIVDLGAGTGSTLRAISRTLGGEQDWTLIERDPALIADGEGLLATAPMAWRYRQLDLARDLETIADGPIDLITASALIDLASAGWLDRLVALRRRTGAALYIVLSYNGRVEWDPADPLDPAVLDLVDAHQRTDKGFGPALGPAAVGTLTARLDARDGDLATTASDWMLGPADRPIQLELLAGYETAAIAVASGRAGEVRAWARRRREHIAAHRSMLRIGHRDLLLLPAALADPSVDSP